MPQAVSFQCFVCHSPKSQHLYQVTRRTLAVSCSLLLMVVFGVVGPTLGLNKPHTSRWTRRLAPVGC